ncbi:hypothetical protein JN11_03792 [Mucilaginibacter frigoritolerans]|uniref:Big-1 domain-containing protein n=1 Tax=Mucilaginibacter frigoritolerans TaxID=652788 RepID=A0A562TV57_9SPHI|nr:carboxypeptidase regulatory-like domain-containing protein [Mucilaginibacter frigoritolerans]TWI96680.1 hypothetical protein JN11_03792 [Mucilaginibacter frigoritolerans]
MDFKKYVLILLFITTIAQAFAQQDSISLNTIVSKTEKLSTEHPFEKIYLHFDKPYYAVSDTVWFKAYLTIGSLHQPSALSRIIYVDVISDKDSIIQSLKLQAANGIAFGDIVLSKALYKQGNYYIRAYTNWMRNFGSEYFFNKAISVGDIADNTLASGATFTKTKKNNSVYITAKLSYKDHDGNPIADKKVNYDLKTENQAIVKGKGVTDKNGFLTVTFQGDKLTGSVSPDLVTSVDQGSKNPIVNTFSLKTILASADVQFFPEGGNLISGVRSKIAFKAVGTDGMGINVSGSVVDNTGVEVATFSSGHAGMGLFPLIPENNKTYKAIVLFPDGSKNTYDLPGVTKDGIVIGVNNNDPDNISIKIATNDQFLKRYQNKGFYIVAQSGGVIYYTGLAALQSLVYTGVIPKSKFPTGILQITLFAADGDPLSERLVFIQHNDAISISLNTNLPSYNVKQKVTMTLSAKNQALPAHGSFSVAVVDGTKIPFSEDAETTILSSLLLTSDLRGYIEKPNYYFNHIDDKKLADLDVLMLTQGYRRFSYTNILVDKYPPITFLAEKQIDISGTLRTESGVPVFKGNVSISIPDRNISANTVTDAEGHFTFSNVSVYDFTKITLSARNNVNSDNLMIMVDIPAAMPLVKGTYSQIPIDNVDSAMNVYLFNKRKQNDNTHLLKEVVIKAQKAKVLHAPYKSLVGLSFEADQVLGPDALKDCSSDFEGCVLGRVFGLWHSDDKYYIQKDYMNGNKKPVKFFVNGLAVDDIYLSSINPADIESIEVFFKDGIAKVMTFYDCNGIISITTKSHSFSPVDKQNMDLSFLTMQKNVITIMPKGFYKARVFYSPVYNTQDNLKDINDFRNTIYWNPNVITDKTGSATFEYYNGEGKGTYRVIVEGIDDDGNIGRTVFQYKVK